jgi:hypothetical protein
MKANMKVNLLLDVAELCLTHLEKRSRVAFVELDLLYKEFQAGKTLCKSTADIHEFRAAVCKMFPIYKNNHKSNKRIKISLHAVRAVCESLSLRLRPLEHMKKI